jgi:peptidyl-prolyl cis-trans isomerase B (cyclophilin B)
MYKHTLALIVLFFAPVLSMANDRPQVMLETSKGNIVIELYRDKAPKTVKNFLDYAESQFYDDFIFHRVIKDWVIQTGAFDRDMVEYETSEPIRNEAANGLKNERGTLAMARYDDPHSADSQFYINLSDNHSLDHKARTMTDYGYCVFGKVTEGMDVVDAIGNVETHEIDGYEDVPVEPVLLIKATILSE